MVQRFYHKFLFSGLPLNEDFMAEAPFDEIADQNDPEHLKPRWTMIPDGDGKMYLVDLNSYDAGKAPLWNVEADVIFMLYTPKNPTVGQKIKIDANVIRDTNFNPDVPTRIIIHGWNNDHKSTVNTLITAAYLLRGDFNVSALIFYCLFFQINFLIFAGHCGRLGRRQVYNFFLFTDLLTRIFQALTLSIISLRVIASKMLES